MSNRKQLEAERKVGDRPATLRPRERQLANLVGQAVGEAQQPAGIQLEAPPTQGLVRRNVQLQGVREGSLAVRCGSRVTRKRRGSGVRGTDVPAHYGSDSP